MPGRSGDPGSGGATAAGGAAGLLEDYRALNDPRTRRRLERQGGYFVVEGLLALGALLASPYPVRSVLATERRAARVEALVAGRAPVLVRPDAEVAGVAGFDVHRGVLAAADRLPLPAVTDVVRRAHLVVVAEGISDHENLGALFRNAAAFGAAAVLLDPTAADPLYRRSVRVSLGHVLRVPWTRLDPWPGGLDALARRGFAVLALTPDAAAVPVARAVAELGPAAGAAGGARVALLVGAEGPGLTGEALAAASCRVRIPLAPGVDSLNVATAAAVALYAVSGDRFE
jgi:tRNA G18 (ribose-2'-O)-methylase SpoU